jgi:hypothetical protein
MPHHQRHVNAAVHVTVKDVKIGAADTAVRNTDLHLACGGGNCLALADTERFLTVIINSLHEDRLLLTLIFPCINGVTTYICDRLWERELSFFTISNFLSWMERACCTGLVKVSGMLCIRICEKVHTSLRELDERRRFGELLTQYLIDSRGGGRTRN